MRSSLPSPKLNGNTRRIGLGGFQVGSAVLGSSGLCGWSAGGVFNRGTSLIYRGRNSVQLGHNSCRADSNPIRRSSNSPWVDGGLFTNSRGMPINALNPGDNYQFQARAVGGSTGYSDWSDAVSHRSL